MGPEFSRGAFCDRKELDQLFFAITLKTLRNVVGHNGKCSPFHLILEEKLTLYKIGLSYVENLFCQFPCIIPDFNFLKEFLSTILSSRLRKRRSCLGLEKRDPNAKALQPGLESGIWNCLFQDHPFPQISCNGHPAQRGVFFRHISLPWMTISAWYSLNNAVSRSRPFMKRSWTSP